MTIEMPPHKVLLFIPHVQQGGAERQILELMRRLPPRFEPTLCLYGGGDATQQHYADYLDSARVHSLGVDTMGPRALKRFLGVLREEAPTILHSYRDKANLWARLVGRRAKVPIIVTSVRNRGQALPHTFLEYCLQGVNARVLANSVGIRKELVEWAGVQPERVEVIHNFLDLDRFRPPYGDERDRARERFGFAPHETVLLLPGRLARQKHQLGLAKALGMLRERRALPDHVRVVLAGRRRDRMYSRLVPLAMRWHGVEDRVTYLEPVKEMTALYHAVDAVVMPSLWEGMSNAVLEAHACALPVVVSHAANLDGIVLDGTTGFEVPTRDHRRLADAIQQVIELDPRERRDMGDRGRAHVAHRFHPDQILQQIVALYDGLLAERGLA